MSTGLLQVVLVFATLSLTLGENCETEIFVNSRKGLTGTIDNTFIDHIEAGLKRQCIEAKVPVEKNSVRCFKWKVMTSKQVQLTERRVVSQGLVLTIGPSYSEVVFRSPGFFKKNKKHYSNSNFCVYNISLDNCNHIAILSSLGHSLFPDSKDYLSVYLDNKFHYLYGDQVGSFIFEDNTSSGSLYAVLWSDAQSHTSRGTFELTARCLLPNTSKVDKGSGSGSLYADIRA